MSRRRNLLHLQHLEDFRSFCAQQGWIDEPTKGDFEVLRMRHPDSNEPLIVNKKDDAKEHLTTWGESARLCKLFFQSRSKK